MRNWLYRLLCLSFMVLLYLPSGLGMSFSEPDQQIAIAGIRTYLAAHTTESIDTLIEADNAILDPLVAGIEGKPMVKRGPLKALLRKIKKDPSLLGPISTSATGTTAPADVPAATGVVRAAPGKIADIETKAGDVKDLHGTADMVGKLTSYVKRLKVMPNTELVWTSAALEKVGLTIAHKTILANMAAAIKAKVEAMSEQEQGNYVFALDREQAAALAQMAVELGGSPLPPRPTPGPIPGPKPHSPRPAPPGKLDALKTALGNLQAKLRALGERLGVLKGKKK